VAHAGLVLYLSLYDANNQLVNGGAGGATVPTDQIGSIPLQSFELSFARSYTPGPVSGGTLGPVDFSPVSFIDTPGTQSLTLADGFANGETFKSMSLGIYQSQGVATARVVGKWDFLSLHVDSYQPGTDGQDGSEAYRIDYNAVDYTFYSYTPSGSLQGTYTQTWNRMDNAPDFTPDAAVTTGVVPDLQFITASSVPEPATLGLAGSVVLLLARRRSARPGCGH